MSRIAEDLAERPGDRSGHREIARRYGLGARTLERAFAAETGLSLGAWRRRARLMEALRLLGAGASVKRVARETG